MTHITPESGPITKGEIWRKSMEILESEDTQRAISKDKEKIKDYIGEKSR